MTNPMDEIEHTRELFGDPRIDAHRARDAARRELDRAMSTRERARRWPFAAAAAVVALLITLPFVQRMTPAAAAELERLAHLDASAYTDIAEDQVLRRRFREVRTEEQSDLVSGRTFSVVTEVDATEWIRSDGSAVRREQIRDASLASTTDQQVWSAAEKPTLPAAGDVREVRFAPGEFFFVPSSRVPADPDTLDSALRDGSIANRPDTDRQVFLLIGDLLAQRNLSEATREALLGVASRLEGITLLGTVTDPLGRSGTGFSVADGVSDAQLIFDPASGELLASQVIPHQGDAVPTWRAFESSDLVRETDVPS
jgi:hypothetical protein